MTFAAHALARALFSKGHDWKEVVDRVRKAGFRITPEEAIAAEAYLKSTPVTGGTVIRKWIV